MIKKGNNQRFLVLMLIVCLVLSMSSFVYADNTPNSEKALSINDEGSPDEIADQEEVPALKITAIETGTAYDIELINVPESDYDYIIMKVWNDQDDEDDAILYPAEWKDVDPQADSKTDRQDPEDDEESIAEPCYLAHILMDHYEYPGTYQVAAYGINVIETDKTEEAEIKTADDITVEILSNEEFSTEIVKSAFEVTAPDSIDPVTEEQETQNPELKDTDSGSSKEETPESLRVQEVIESEKEISPVTKAVTATAAVSAAPKVGSALLGIDVSHHNGSIDWAKVKKAGIKFVIIRCGYGDNYTSQDDKKWSYNVSQCEKLGIQYGVYIYSYATNTTMAKSEADHCIRLLKGHKPKYPVYLDLEDSDQSALSNATLKSITVAWATKIKSAGYTPGVYSSKYWWTNKLTSTDYNNYNKWVAQWNTSCTYKGIYHMWQYSDAGSVSGISGNVDMDYWYGSAPPITVGWNTIDGKKYYFDKNGAMLTGWQTIDGQRYYFGTDGAMLTGWQTIEGTQYYFNTSGEMVTGWENVHVEKASRVYGTTRYETSFKVADELKKKLGKSKFSAVILADGRNYPDGLAGSYMSCMLDAPVLLVNNSSQDQIKQVQTYVKNNLTSGGKVYMLGGSGVLPLSLEKALTVSGYKVTRLGGKDRYETNIRILSAASTGKEFVVCTGKGFADSLSAAALGKPILLVKSSLTNEQKQYLNSISGTKTFYIIGGTAAVSDKIQTELKAYGTTTRIGGKNRYETSVNVAKKFFSIPETVTVTYGKNFPDGLCGGALAYKLNGPMILAAEGSSREAEAYTLTAGMTNGEILGGPKLISDKLVRAIYYMKNGTIETK